MKLIVGDLDRDFERRPVIGGLVALREPNDRQVPPAIGALSIEIISLIRPLVPRVRRRDRSLATQLVRAASDAAMNVAEAERAEPASKKQRFVDAASNVNETQAALRVAIAWGYVEAAEAEPANALLGRMNAMLTRLTRV
jgi:four helix bundle protein